jgi:hypothetical protein
VCRVYIEQPPPKDENKHGQKCHRNQGDQPEISQDKPQGNHNCWLPTALSGHFDKAPRRLAPQASFRNSVTSPKEVAVVKQPSVLSPITITMTSSRFKLPLTTGALWVGLLCLLDHVDCFGWTNWNQNLLHSVSDCPTFDGNRTGICVSSAAECRNRK